MIKNVSSGAALGPNWFKQKDLQLVGKGETKIKFGTFRAKKKCQRKMRYCGDHGVV